MPHVITITGPSGAGKSTTLRFLENCGNRVFRPEMVPKYTTRPPHEDDEGEVICVEHLPAQCDLVYEQYGDRYGLELRDIFDLVAEGKSPIVILNDVRAVEDVRNTLGGLVRSIFVFMESPTLERFKKLARTKGLLDEEGKISKEDLELRLGKAQALYRIYIENIHLFDHVIINCGSFDDLDLQVKQIVKGLRQDRNWPLREKRAA